MKDKKINKELFNAAVALLVAGNGEEAGRMFLEAGVSYYSGHPDLCRVEDKIKIAQKDWSPVNEAFYKAGKIAKARR